MHAHESPLIMIAPLGLLAFLSLTAGFGGGMIDGFLATYFGTHMPHPDDPLLETIGLSAGFDRYRWGSWFLYDGERQIGICQTDVGSTL